jgi:hypothetical protein
LAVPDPLPKRSSAGIMMSTIRPLNISVNESDQSVWVDAGWWKGQASAEASTAGLEQHDAVVVSFNVC